MSASSDHYIIGYTPAQELEKAIALVLSPGSETQNPRPGAARELLAHLDAQGLEVNWCIEVKQDQITVAACLGIISPGRVGMVLLNSRDSAQAAQFQLGEALRILEFRAREAGALLLQAILPAADHRHDQCLQLVQYQYLAELHYLALTLSGAAPDAAHVAELIFEPYDPGVPQEFNRTLEKTYDESRDCPGLAGIRPTEDIILSHKSSGIHDPNLWYLVRSAKQVIGVLLLTRMPLTTAIELVYVGVTPEHRGQGYGKQLVRFAVEQTAAAGCTHLTLAVDSRNDHALKIYRAFGFRETDRRRTGSEHSKKTFEVFHAFPTTLAGLVTKS